MRGAVSEFNVPHLVGCGIIYGKGGVAIAPLDIPGVSDDGVAMPLLPPAVGMPEEYGVKLPAFCSVQNAVERLMRHVYVAPVQVYLRGVRMVVGVRGFRSQCGKLRAGIIIVAGDKIHPMWPSLPEQAECRWLCHVSQEKEVATPLGLCFCER